MGVANVPTAEIEIGEKEHEKGRRKDSFAGCTPYPLGASRHVKHLAPESEIDPDVHQHRPTECGGGRKHEAALDDKKDGQEQRQQAGNADHDAMVEREAVDLVLVGIRLPKIDLWQLVRPKLHDVGDHGAGIEGDAEDVGGGAILAIGPVAGAGGNVDDAG